MTRSQLFALIQQKKSFLCVGLDTDVSRIPSHLLGGDDPIFEFNKAIIDATIDLAVAYKPNTAFYEAMGLKGWVSLQRTVEYLKSLDHDAFLIADAKRGDIGNTSTQYAEAFFTQMDFDAVTVAPYMGYDSVAPFLSYEGKWTILLALTSNQGASDFQLRGSDEPLFEKVIRTSSKWGSPDNLMYVVGATQTSQLERIRDLIPNHFLLVPGVGAQGGDIKQVASIGLNSHCGLLVNSSRSILYASSDLDFEVAARSEAQKLQKEMEALLNAKGLI